MKIYDYGKWTKVYENDGHGFENIRGIYRGHLTESQISEICRNYGSYEYLANGKLERSWVKVAPSVFVTIHGDL
jgi:hypothetical protein